MNSVMYGKGICLFIVVFFFFKQKTAYEIYQCDWSSDVCSSDLDDDKIKFLFIDIEEKGDVVDKKVRGFIEKNNYTDRKSVV